MIKKLSIDVWNMLTMELNIKGFLQKILAWLKETFNPFSKGRLPKKYLERRECKKVLGEAFSNVLEASFLNPNPNKRKESQLANTSKRGESLKDVIHRVDREIKKKKSPIFAPGAFPVLKKNIKRYICRLISQSIEISEQMRVSNISDTHIEQAVDALGRSKSRKRYRIMATFGGLLTGVGVPWIIRMFMAPIHTDKEIVIFLAILAMVIVGLVFMAWGLVNE